MEGTRRDVSMLNKSHNWALGSEASPAEGHSSAGSFSGAVGSGGMEFVVRMRVMWLFGFNLFSVGSSSPHISFSSARKVLGR